MAYQSGKNVIVAYKAQSALGSPASGGSGLGLRIREGSGGFEPTKALIESAEVRRDSQTTRGRHGSRSAPGTYEGELSVGELDTWLQAVLRSTWTASADITEATASLTSITTTTSTIVAGGGSWLTAGVRVGDMVKLAGHATAANNGIWLRVVTVTASTITVAGTPLTLNATPDTAFTLTIARNLIQPTAPTERYFTVDEYFADLDLSVTYTDVKAHSLTIRKMPDQPITWSLGLLGLDYTANATGASPVLTSPTFTTGLPLVMADGTIRINGVDYADLTSFELTIELGAAAPPVLAANPPDVFLGNARVRGQFTCLRTDLDFFSAFDAETTQDLFIHCPENETDPKDFISFYAGNLVFDSNTAPIGSEGALIETVRFRCGKDETGGSRAATMLKIATSAA